MNWDDARMFLAVARTGQLLAASRRLGVNHATLSRRVSALEEALKIVPMNRLGRAEEVAAAVSFLMSDEAAYITRQVLGVNGGII